MQPHPSIWRGYAFAWVTLGLFAFTLAGHWILAWFAYVDEQLAHGQAVELGMFAVQTSRDMLENWQSEFLQLLWQVGGLALFLHLGSPQSREGDDRKEEKIDAILRRLDPEHGQKTIADIDEKYTRKQ
jgi:lysylphosphatidylglycerol synthetase-like protein (DUF2156 family)